MKNYILLLSLNLFILSGTQAQFVSGVMKIDSSQSIEEDASIPRVKYANTITSKDLFDHLSVLASDEYEGRETGEPGNYKAAEYLAKQLEKRGFPKITEDGYYQKIAFSSSNWEAKDLMVDTVAYRNLWDYLAFPSKSGDMVYEEDEVLFLGYGIHDNRYSDYRNNDVKGKTILIYEGEPVMEDSTYWLSGGRQPSLWSDNDNKLKIAQRQGVKSVLIIKNDIKKFLGENRRLALGRSTTLGDISDEKPVLAPHVFISSDIAKAILGDKSKKVIQARNKIKEKGKPKKVKIKTNLSLNFKRKLSVLKGYNVLGFVEGKSKKEEVIVVSAHYDHVGFKGDDVYNGADDNGSGTSTVLEIAEAMMKAKQEGNGPERSILFLWVTGEEKGLLGSEYYAANPIFPLENTVADVNIDMVGRVDEKYKDNPNYIYVIGSDRLSTDLHRINEQMNQKYSQIVLDYKYNDEKDPNRFYFRSDHYNFAKNGIPAIFFFNGVHEDYHRPTDTVDKINFEKMEKIGRLIFQTAWELSNRPGRIRLNSERGA